MKKFSRKICNYYAQKIYNLEKELEKDKMNKSLYKEIEEIVDHIAKNYPPDSMYKIDEKIYSLAAQDNNIG